MNTVATGIMLCGVSITNLLTPNLERELTITTQCKNRNHKKLSRLNTNVLIPLCKKTVTFNHWTIQ